MRSQAATACCSLSSRASRLLPQPRGTLRGAQSAAGHAAACYCSGGCMLCLHDR
jgi:hypothetical protein